MSQSKSTSKRKGKQTPREEEKAPASAEEAAVPEKQAAPRESEQQAQDRLLRLQADFDNFRKRTQREKAMWTRQAHEDFFEDLLPVLDHFELGLNTAVKHQADPAVVEGFQMVFNQLLALLEKYGVKPIDAEGETFDPHVHEAITHVPSEEHPADVVITQTRRGYRLGEKLLRAAQVVVSSGPDQPAPESETNGPDEGEA